MIVRLDSKLQCYDFTSQDQSHFGILLSLVESYKNMWFYKINGGTMWFYKKMVVPYWQKKLYNDISNSNSSGGLL